MNDAERAVDLFTKLAGDGSASEVVHLTHALSATLDVAPRCLRYSAIEPAGGASIRRFDTDEPCPFGFLGDPTVVLFFISWAFSMRFGGMHELAQAAMHMQRRHKVDLKPLLTYADRDAESEDDRRELERAWQEATPLAASARAVAMALESDDAELRRLTAGYEELAPRLRELAAICDWAASRGAGVRLSFWLE
ncbi:MAG: hypothetical protein U0446_01945 [Dehalococcoidia bacterium]